jgi:hypothetical protein
LAKAALAIFDCWAAGSFQPVRLIGVTAARMTSQEAPPGLFPDPQCDQQRKVDAATDAITMRFGKGAIRRGGVT